MVFNWTAGTGVTASGIWVGTTLGGSESTCKGHSPGRTATVSNMPTDGSTVYVRLWSLVGGAWQYIDYTYTASQAKA